MTRKHSPPVATDGPVTKGLKWHPKGQYSEPRSKSLPKREAGKGVGASQDNGTSNRSLKDIVAPQPSYQHWVRFLTHASWAAVVSLLVMFAVNKSGLAPITGPCKPCPSANSVTNTHSATTSPTSLSRETDSSSSLLGSHTTPAASKILMDCIQPPQKRSIVSAASGACACITITVTVVCNNPIITS